MRCGQLFCWEGNNIRKRNNRVLVHLNDTELLKLKQDAKVAGICREKYIRLVLMGITIHPRPPDNYGKVLQAVFTPADPAGM